MASTQTGQAKSSEKSPSNDWRNKGNELYLSAVSQDLAPCLRQQRIQQAIPLYMKALEVKTNDDELSSAAKNLAMASWRLVGLTAEKYAQLYYLREAAKYFGVAYNSGLPSKPRNWQETLLCSTREFIDDSVNFCQNLKYETRSQIMKDIANAITESILKAMCFLHLADFSFKAGISELAAGNYKECMKYMHECYTPVEEARRCGQNNDFIQTEVRVKTEEVFMYQCTSESIQARVTGDDLFEAVLTNEDNLNINMVWDVVDWYKRSILLTREQDVEHEAIGHSRLGKVYDKVLKLRVKAKENFMRCLELANSMHPRCFTCDKWYQECTQTLARYQQEVQQKEEDEWTKEKSGILLELNKEIKKLEEVSQSAEDLLNHIYTVHPPKNKSHTLNKSLLGHGEERNVKKALREALLHYHPDRLKAIELGKKWIVLCEEITKYLNRKYEVYK